MNFQIVCASLILVPFAVVSLFCAGYIVHKALKT